MKFLHFGPRIFATGLLLVPLSGCSPAASSPGIEPPAEEDAVSSAGEIPELRHKARWRKRRLIFNNDGDDALFFPSDLPVTPRNLLERRTIPVIGTQVDSIFYCTTQSIGAYTHRSDVAELLARDLPREGFRNSVGEFAKQGTDPLEIVTDHCRREGIEIFATLRMNDVHDSSDRFSVLGSKFKRQNFRALFGTSRKPPPYGYWSGADFSWKVIRDMTFQVLEEMASNYDLDGLELDFWRHPPYFKTYAWGEPVTPAETDSITRLMRRVRRMADARGRERGRPLLIAVRVMDSPGLSLDMGLDLVTWLQEDLVDLVIVGEVALAPWEETIRLAHRYGVPVYPCIRRSMMGEERGSLESFRAQALTAWKLGADGIYLFNLFPDENHDRKYRELGDPNGLERLDKLYSLDPVGRESFKRYIHDFDQYKAQKPVSPLSPVELKPDSTYAVPMYLADRSLSQAILGKRPRVQARLQLENLDPQSAVGLSVNGHRLEPEERVQDELRYSISPTQLHTGYNHFRIFVPAGAAPRLKDILVSVLY